MLSDQSAEPESAVPGEPCAAGEFALVAGPVCRKLTKRQSAEWERTYETGHRTIRRWWDEGAPLHDSAAMPIWWEKERAAGRKAWSVPDKLLKAAAHAPKPSAPAAPLIGEVAAPTATETPAASGTPAAGPPINLEDFDPEEGHNLRGLKQLKAARWAEIRKKLEAGSDVGHLQTSLVKLEDMISRIEARIEERLKKKGLYVLVSVVSRDLAKLAEMMRQMTDTEVRRVLELCPNLSVEARQQVATAVLKVAAARQRVLRNLKSIKTPDDALLQLAAA